MSKIKVILLSLVSVLFACGEKDDIQPEPTSVSISSIRIITMPLTDAGNAWDADGDADVYVQIENPTNVLYQYPGTYDNVQATQLPLLFTVQPSYVLPAMDQSYYVSIYDYDITTADDYISNVGFNPNQFKKDRPHSKTFSSGSAKIEVSFNWN